MVVRARPINWSLLLNPTMAGLQMEAEASARLGQSIAGVGQNIGAGIANRRQEAESKRRYDEGMSLQREELDLRKKVHEDTLLEKARDRQAAESTALDALETMVGGVTKEAAATGQVRPETQQGLKDLVDFFGGPEAAQEKLGMRLVTPDHATPWHDRYTAIPAHKRIAGDPDFDKFMAEYSASGAQMSPVNVPGPKAPKPAPAADEDMIRTMPQAPGGGAALRPTGTVGEAGVDDLPALDLRARAEAASQQRDLAQKAMESARAVLSSRSLHSTAGRAKAKLAYDQALTVWLAAGREADAYTRRAVQADKRETTAATLQAKEAEKAEKVKVQRQILGIMFKSDKYAHFTPDQWAYAADLVEQGNAAKDAMAEAENPRVEAVRKEGDTAFAKESLKTPEEIEVERLKAEAEGVRAQREINTGTTPESIGGFRGATQGETATTKAETSGAETPAEKQKRVAGERSEKEQIARDKVASAYELAVENKDEQVMGEDGKVDPAKAAAYLRFLKSHYGVP